MILYITTRGFSNSVLVFIWPNFGEQMKLSDHHVKYIYPKSAQHRAAVYHPEYLLESNQSQDNDRGVVSRKGSGKEQMATCVRHPLSFITKSPHSWLDQLLPFIEMLFKIDTRNDACLFSHCCVSEPPTQVRATLQAWRTRGLEMNASSAAHFGSISCILSSSPSCNLKCPLLLYPRNYSPISSPSSPPPGAGAGLDGTTTASAPHARNMCDGFCV
jgi:hypothetical protein